MKFHRGVLLLAGLSVSGGSLAESAGATGTDGAPDAIPLQRAVRTAPTATVLESIEVTAQRRRETIQDVPVTMSAFSGQTLQLRNINDPFDLQFMVPGMVYTGSGQYTFPYLRGVGSNSFLPSIDSSIQTFLDGVYSASILSSFKNFADIERIEVLKGPQGTLFGRNSTGGVISITTREAGDHLESAAALYGGSLNKIGGSAYLGGPLSERLGFSVSGYLESQGHHYTNINPDGPQPGDTRNWGLRVKTRFDFSDRVSLRLHSYVGDEDGVGTAIWENVRPTPDVVAAGGQTVDTPRQFNSNRGGFSATRTIGTDARVTVQLEDAEFWSLTAYQYSIATAASDLDGTNADVSYTFIDHSHYTKSFSQEFQLASLGRRKLEWLTGAYYFDGIGGWDPIFLELGPESTPRTAVFDPLAQALAQLGNPAGGGLGPTATPPATLFWLYGVIDNQAWSAFAEATWRFTPSWALTGGLRYSYEERLLVRGSSSVQAVGSPDEPIPVRDFRNLPADWRDLTPKLGLEWQSGPLLAYLTYTEGFKSGSWNSLPLAEPVSLVEPERVRSWEIGLKSDLWDGRLRLNAAAYSYDYQDMQVFITSIRTNGTAKIENAGRARINGLEVDLTVAPWANWSWMLAGAYTDAEYREFLGTGYDENGQPFEGDFSGNQLMYTPRETVSTELAYTLPLRSGDLIAAVNYYHSSRYFFDAQNDFEHPAYRLLGARLAYALPERGLQISLIGSNLAEEDYENHGILLDFGQVVSDAPGRLLTLRVDWQFSE